MASNGVHAAKADPERLTTDNGHPNVLRKGPVVKSDALSTSPSNSRAKLVKPRADAGDNEPLTHPEQTNQAQSKSNRLRKAFGVASSATPVSPATKDSPESSWSRKVSDSSTPSQSPNLAKESLPKMLHAPSRPAPMRSQSYSKRHASFDTPREVPLPAYPFGVGSLFDHSQPLEDSDGDSDTRKAAWAQLENTIRDFTLQPSAVARNVRHEPDPSNSKVPKGPEGYFAYNPEPPHMNRNNSAPTPPHTTEAERVGMRYVGQRPDLKAHVSTDELGSGSGSGSETFPTPYSAQLSSEDYGVGPSSSTPPNSRVQSQDALQSASEEGHLSTSSLPLPTSYGAEQVNRLPATPKPASQAKSDYSGGWENAQVKTPTNVVDNPFDRSDKARDGSHVGNSGKKLPLRRQSSTHRSSYPLVAQHGREIPLPDIPRTDPSLSSRAFVPPDTLGNSRPFPDKPSQHPKVEAPEKLLHPLLARNFSTPDAASSINRSGVSSIVATPGHEGNLDSLDQITGSPTHTNATDRTSNASGSSGASSDLSSHLTSDLASDAAQRGAKLGPSSSEASIQQPIQHEPQSQNAMDAGNGRNLSTAMTVETTGTSYILTALLPGYSRDEITLSTRKKRILHIVADGFVSGCGHFERRVSFGYDADMTRIRAEFNGQLLRITVPRRPTSSASAIGPSSAAFNAGSATTTMFGRGRNTMV